MTAEVASEVALHAAEERLSDREIGVLSLKIIFTKLGVTDRTQAVMLAMRRGIIAP